MERVVSPHSWDATLGISIANMEGAGIDKVATFEACQSSRDCCKRRSCKGQGLNNLVLSLYFPVQLRHSVCSQVHRRQRQDTHQSS